MWALEICPLPKPHPRPCPPAAVDIFAMCLHWSLCKNKNEKCTHTLKIQADSVQAGRHWHPKHSPLLPSSPVRDSACDSHC